MPAITEVLALPAPPPGGLKDATPSTLDEPENNKENEIASLEEKQKSMSVATHTKSIGIIHPPPDIRSIVDKTATFVARNGPEFEKRILATNKNNVKFNFLIPTDPYHAYYRYKVNEFSPSQTLSQTIIPAAQPTTQHDAAAKPTQSNLFGAKPSEEKPFSAIPKPIETPEAEQYTVRLPEGLSGLDLDVIKLTAQFVARNGKSFLTGLTSREHMNPQFHFLKPTHSMFTFFTALTDAYSKVLMPPKGMVDRLKKDVSDYTVILDRCFSRLEWEKSQQRARRKAEDEIEAERAAMAMIDWHDFVVVETIEFTEEEEQELPAPMTLEEIIRRSKKLSADEDLSAEDRTAIAATGIVVEEKEMEMDMDEDELAMVQEGMQSASISEPVEETTDQVDAAMEQDMDEEDEEEEEERKVVKTWKRPEERLASQKEYATKYVVSPITGELIPIAEMAEHMRISLIDPKYKEQKERMMAKMRENTLAGDEEIGLNIVELAKTRPDIFGTTEEEVSNAVKAEMEKKKKEEPKHVVWDGHVASIVRTTTQAISQGMSLEEQIAAIHREKTSNVGDGNSLLGPSALPAPSTKLPMVRPLPPPSPPGMTLNFPQFPSSSVIKPGLNLPLRPPSPAPPSIRTPLPPPPSLPTSVNVSSLRAPSPVSPLPSSTMALSSIRPVLSLSSAPSPLSRPPLITPLPRPTFQVNSVSLPSLHALGMMGVRPLSSMDNPNLPPPPPPEEREQKRQKVEDVQLIPEDVFLAQHPGSVQLTVNIPHVEGEPNLNGQTIQVSVNSLKDSVSSLKDKIASEISLPANKQKLSGKSGFFKDSLSLAYYNLGPGDHVTLGLRERGGRKR